MFEVWLRSNRRVLLLALVPAGLLLVAGGLMLAWLDGWAVRSFAWALCAAGLVAMVGLLRQLRQPRVAYRAGEVLFFLKAGGPICVPVNVVEAFFLGQGPAHLPGADQQKTKATNLVARLSQREPQWAQVEVKEALGKWCEGYVTMRGTWCEPLNGEVIRRLNRRLGEVTREFEAFEASLKKDVSA